MGLLDDLKKQADRVRAQEGMQHSLRLENVEAVEAALQRAFRYLNELLEQLKVIKPVNPVIYRLPGIGEFRDLALTDAFVASRTHKVGDTECLQRVDLYMIWATPNNLTIEHDLPPAAQKARELLWRFGIRFDETEQRNDAGGVALTRFIIPQAIRVGLTLRADYEARRVVAMARNMLRLGGDEFALPADECTEPVLESLAQMLLGQPSTFRNYWTVLQNATAVPRR